MEDEDDGEEIENEFESEGRIQEIAKKLEEFRKENHEHYQKKLVGIIDKNLEFHEWMERYKPMDTSSSSQNMQLKNELAKLGAESAIPHPFCYTNSPFFSNLSKDTMIEIKNPPAEMRPFEDIKQLKLIDMSKEKETGVN